MSLGSLFAGPDGPKQKQSQAEWLGNKIRLDDDIYREKYFFPLEQQQVAKAYDPETHKVRRGIIASRRNAEVAKAEAEAIASARQRAMLSGSHVGGGANVAAFDDANRAVESGLRAYGAETDFDVQNLRDQDLTNIVKTGRNLQQGIYSGLSGLANAQETKAAGRIAARKVKQDAQNKALGDALAMAGYVGISGYQDASNVDMGNDQLGPFARFLRGRGVGAPDKLGESELAQNPYGVEPNTRIG